MRRVIAAEVYAKEQLNPLYNHPNMRPMAVMSAYRENGWDLRPEGQLEFLISGPAGMKFLRADWWGDPRLEERSWFDFSTKTANQITEALGGEGIDLFYTDQEHPTRDPRALTSWMSPLSLISRFSCNFNDAVHGSGTNWEYFGKTGKASCWESYDYTSNEAMARGIRNLSLHRSRGEPVVAHLPICWKANSREKLYDVDLLIRRTRQYVMSCACYGVEIFIFAGYMIGDFPISHQTKYVEALCNAVSDADIIWPLEQEEE